MLAAVDEKLRDLFGGEREHGLPRSHIFGVRTAALGPSTHALTRKLEGEIPDFRVGDTAPPTQAPAWTGTLYQTLRKELRQYPGPA